MVNRLVMQDGNLGRSICYQYETAKVRRSLLPSANILVLDSCSVAGVHVEPTGKDE